MPIISSLNVNCVILVKQVCFTFRISKTDTDREPYTTLLRDHCYLLRALLNIFNFYNWR